MKGIILGIIIILFFADLNGQNQANKMFISNKLTKNHIRIPGTHLYLVSPKNFSISKTFIGLSNNLNTNIVVLDIFGSNFYTQSKEFSKETFEKTGLTIYESKEFKFNNISAKYLYTNSLNSSDKNLMLAFGDSTFTVLISATISADGKNVFKTVEKCLLSAIYNKEIKFDPLETAQFELDLSKSEFKFEKQSNGLYFYTLDKIIPKNQNYFIATQMPYQDSSEEILKLSTKQMIDKAKEYGTDDLELDFKKLEINGCQAIETTGYGKKNGEKILYYLLVVGKQNNITVVNSIIQSDFEENLKKIMEVAHTIKLKQ